MLRPARIRPGYRTRKSPVAWSCAGGRGLLPQRVAEGAAVSHDQHVPLELRQQPLHEGTLVPTPGAAPDAKGRQRSPPAPRAVSKTPKDKINPQVGHLLNLRSALAVPLN